jgi:hypothetical protein
VATSLEELAHEVAFPITHGLQTRATFRSREARSRMVTGSQRNGPRSAAIRGYFVLVTIR